MLCLRLLRFNRNRSRQYRCIAADHFRRGRRFMAFRHALCSLSTRSISLSTCWAAPLLDAYLTALYPRYMNGPSQAHIRRQAACPALLTTVDRTAQKLSEKKSGSILKSKHEKRQHPRESRRDKNQSFKPYKGRNAKMRMK